MRRVRVNSWYIFQPNLLDKVHSQDIHPKPGQRVKVINLPGCPKANTMGQCYVEDTAGVFRGMVSVYSLQRV